MRRRRTRPLRADAWFLSPLMTLLMLQGCTTPDPASQYQDDPEALARGEAVFAGTCSGYCHVAGIAVADVPDLFDCAWIHGGSNQEIYNTITNGVPGSRMVAYGGTLPDGDDDMWKIIAFLKNEGSSC